MSNTPYTADKAVPDQEMEIEEIQDSDITIKLLEMGLMPGKLLTLLYIAPFGDPLAFQLGESLIALRKEEARLIRVINRKETV